MGKQAPELELNVIYQNQNQINTIDQLMNALNDKNWWVRYQAILRLKNFENSSIDLRSIVVQLLNDEYPVNRMLAINLYKNEFDLSANILEMTYDSNPAVRLIATTAIWEILQKDPESKEKSKTELIDAIGSMDFERKKKFLFNTLSNLANEKRPKKEKLKIVMVQIQKQLPDDVYYSLINDKNDDIKIQALSIIIARNNFSKKNQQLIDVAINNLYNNNQNLVFLCLEIIQKSNYKEAVDLIIPLTCSYNISIRIEALNTLKAINIERFKSADHINIFSLMNRDDRKRTLEFLYGYLNREETGLSSRGKEFESIVRHVLDSFEKINSELAIPTIKFLISDKQSNIREKAAELLCRLGFPEHLGDIFELLKENDFGILNTVLKFLDDIDSELILLDLMKFYKNNAHNLLPNEVASFLGNIFDEHGIEVEAIDRLNSLEIVDIVKEWKKAKKSAKKTYEIILIYLGQSAILYLEYIRKSTKSKAQIKDIDSLIERIYIHNNIDQSSQSDENSDYLI